MELKAFGKCSNGSFGGFDSFEVAGHRLRERAKWS